MAWAIGWILWLWGFVIVKIVCLFFYLWFGLWLGSKSYKTFCEYDVYGSFKFKIFYPLIAFVRWFGEYEQIAGSREGFSIIQAFIYEGRDCEPPLKYAKNWYLLVMSLLWPLKIATNVAIGTGILLFFILLYIFALACFLLKKLFLVFERYFK